MRTLSVVDTTAAATLGALAGLALAALAWLAVGLSGRPRPRPVTPAVPGPASPLAAGVADVLAVLRSSGIVLDSADAVVNHSPAAVSQGLVRGGELVHAELLHLARRVRRDGVIREAEFELKGGVGRPSLVVGARVAPLGRSHVLLLVDDRSQARRVEEIRRDFVVNVSHELKTPVGGLALLAEAVLDGHDDPEAVARFARRMQVEATRLTGLVQEIVDLSRLQLADALKEPAHVDLAAAALEAVERSRVSAEAKDIHLLSVVDVGCLVWGEPDLLVTAIRNLIGNAVAYSDPHGKVTIKVSRRGGDLVEVAVTDQGHGIPTDEQPRIFERFYRVDEARSRNTGGTGLGLSIVKHVCANHGGEVTVWSEPGRGSTFTMRLPAALAGAPGLTPSRTPVPSRPSQRSESHEVT